MCLTLVCLSYLKLFDQNGLLPQDFVYILLAIYVQVFSDLSKGYQPMQTLESSNTYAFYLVNNPSRKIEMQNRVLPIEALWDPF